MLVNSYAFSSTSPVAFDPVELFSEADLGAVFDFTDATTLWQDEAATIPAVVDARVARVDDRSGKGCHAYQQIQNLRPFLRRSSSGKLYLEGNGSNWMFVGYTAAATNFAQMVSIISQSAISTYTAIFGKPHAAGHVDPYYRWAFWRTDQSTIECRVNGVPRTSGSGWTINNNVVLTFDSPNAFLRAGNQGNTYSPVVGLSYPNQTQARLFANGAGGEAFNGRIFSLFVIDRPLTSDERAKVVAWAETKMP